MSSYSLQADNGILGQVPGEELGAALKLLPAAGPGVPERMTVDFESPRHGAIRITFRSMANPRRGFYNWMWTPCHAELVGERPASA